MDAPSIKKWLTAASIFVFSSLPLFPATADDLPSPNTDPSANPRAANQIHQSTRTVVLNEQTITDHTYRDGLGREVYFRGWNVSGSVKLADKGFKPFKTTEDAAKGFRLLREYTGANIARFTVGWEGTHPQVDIIDYLYLDAIVQQVKQAIANGVYVFIDYHVDLYSRHLFTAHMPHTGNGAPEWITRGSEYPASGCGIVCFAWGQNNVTNLAVRKAYRNFFDNEAITTDNGERHVQDEFLWQLDRSIAYIKANLTDEEFDFVLGVQPFNEPIYGVGHTNRASEYDNEKLWPFYKRVKAIMDTQGWNDKWVYAEPQVFWDTNVGFFTPPTGGGYLNDKPGAGFVFAPHFYDAGRMGVSNLNRVENAEYFENIDRIREEMRFLDVPVLLGEYGMWLGDQNGGSKDHARIVKATYQAMEASDEHRTEKDRSLDFYTPLISGTQWHWDIYKDQHEEYMNGNANKLITHGDGWNDEDFSVIKGEDLTVNHHTVQRVYPRRIQGNVVNFYYNDLTTDGANITPLWASIKAGNQQVFKDKEFALLTWQGQVSSAPTEIFIPKHFDINNLTILTDGGAFQGNPLEQAANDDLWATQDLDGNENAGYRLMIQTDAATPAEQNIFHYALIVDNNELNEAALNQLQADITETIQQQQLRPIYLTGNMQGNEYPAEEPQTYPVTITEIDSYQFYMWRLVSLKWESDEAVTIFKNGKAKTNGRANGKKYFWSSVGKKDLFRICKQSQPTACSKEVTFY